LREVRQLFHTLDPAPFREKDLDDDAERYLLEAYQEAGTPSEAATDAAHNLPDAVHNYYADRERELRLDLIRLLRYGAVCLGIGVAFLIGSSSPLFWIEIAEEPGITEFARESVAFIGA
jgi:hypothetical protein